jgi:hypothetical protein
MVRSASSHLRTNLGFAGENHEAHPSRRGEGPLLGMRIEES